MAAEVRQEQTDLSREVVEREHRGPAPCPRPPYRVVREQARCPQRGLAARRQVQVIGQLLNPRGAVAEVMAADRVRVIGNREERPVCRCPERDEWSVPNAGFGGATCG